MNCVLVALWAMLLNLKTIWIISPILTRNVVTILAVFACQSDLWTNVVTCHFLAFQFWQSNALPANFVPRAGLEPATQRL